MNPPFKYIGNLNGPAYYQTCPILHAYEKLRFRYYEYSTSQQPWEQQKIIRTAPHHTIAFLLKGEIHLNWGEYKDVVITAGEMFFLPRGAEFTGYITSDVNIVLAIIERAMTNKEQDDLRAMKSYEGFSKYEFKPMTMHPPMVRLAESVKDYLVNGVNCSHLHEAKFKELYVILHWYYSQADNAQLFYPMTESISPFRNFILDNFTVTTTIEELLEKSNMSRSTFDRKFKSTFLTTPQKWIEEHTRQLIMNKAAEPNITVKDIMYEVGVYNSSQFTKLCKRLCGKTPSTLIRSI